MSQTQNPQTGGSVSDDDTDAWAELADHREALEICIENDTPYKQRAQQLIDELEKRGYT